MRWLACHPGPNFSVQDVHIGWVEALRAAGEKVAEFPLGAALTFYDHAMMRTGATEFRKAMSGKEAIELAVDRLAGALYKVRPQVLLLTSGFFIQHELLDLARRDGTRVVLLATEQPYETERELALAEHCDVAVLNDPTHLAAFQQVTTAWYQPHSYRPSLHTPGPADPALACDMAFVGTGYPSRIAFLEAMDLDGLDVLLAGNWQQLADESPLRPFVAHDLDECLDNAQTVEVYRSASVNLNLYRREAEHHTHVGGWAVGPREVELAAVGAFFLRDPRPEGDGLFPSLPTFTSPGEAGELLRWWLAHPREREDAAAKAREAITDWTFDNAAARLLRNLQGA